MKERYNGSENSWKLFSEPTPVRLSKDLEHEAFVQFVSKGDRDWDREAEIANKIFDENLKGLSYHQAFQTYLGIFKRLSDIHLPLEKQNKPRSVGVLSTFQQNLSCTLANEYAEKIPQKYIEELDEEAIRLQQSSYPTNWYFPKVKGISVAVEGTKKKLAWIEFLKERIRVDENKVNIAELEQSSAEILKRIKEERAYGIKSCYFYSPLFLKDSQVFQIHDETFGITDKTWTRDMNPSTLANFVPGATANSINRPVVDEYVNQSQVKYNSLSFQTYIGIFSMDNNGELQMNNFSRVPLRSLFEKNGALVQYELLRAFLLMRVYDLTRRSDIVAKMPSIDKLESSVVRQGLFGKAKAKEIDYKSLIVPRIKYEENNDEKDGNIPTDGVVERKFIDRHHVTWFVRRLPASYHVTERATFYAKQHGVILNDGETIVREHYRGRKKDESTEKPTRAIFR